MDIKFTGLIIATEPIQTGVSQNGQQWTSQNFVIEELNQQYPSRAVFQVFGGDKIQQFALKVNDVVTVHLGMKARQGKDGRWYNSIDCWKVDRFGGSQYQGGTQPTQAYPQGQVVQSQIGQPTVAPINQQMAAYPPQPPVTSQPGTATQQQGGLPF